MPNDAHKGLEKSPPQDAKSEGGSLAASVRSDPDNFRRTLQEATAGDRQNGSDALKQFDVAGGPEIVDDGAASKNVELAQVTGAERTNPTDRTGQTDAPDPSDRLGDKVYKDGKLVRERSATGNDTVIAYDKEGAPHRFEDKPIDKLPVDFSGIPEWRREQLTKQAGDLIKAYNEGDPPGTGDGKVSFTDLSKMMKDVAARQDLTEVEKARLWSDVRIGLQKNDVTIDDSDEKPEMIDSWKGSGDPWHAIITLDDGYHGNRLINMNEKDASQAIQDHENGAEADKMPFPRNLIWRGAKAVLGVNTGDINASEGTLRALRAYRSGGTFQHYADAWEKEFVK
ncbi:MAG: hypothetical protein H6677_27495 [Candidatus Obscuribacterales bacterium]|nr:hypothetical protein [Candidatus Obscuribacterales bacterium]